jgi:hypothetical protein
MCLGYAADAAACCCYCLDSCCCCPTVPRHAGLHSGRVVIDPGTRPRPAGWRAAPFCGLLDQDLGRNLCRERLIGLTNSIAVHSSWLGLMCRLVTVFLGSTAKASLAGSRREGGRAPDRALTPACEWGAGPRNHFWVNPHSRLCWTLLTGCAGSPTCPRISHQQAPWGGDSDIVRLVTQSTQHVVQLLCCTTTKTPAAVRCCQQRPMPCPNLSTHSVCCCPHKLADNPVPATGQGKAAVTTVSCLRAWRHAACCTPAHSAAQHSTAQHSTA